METIGQPLWFGQYRLTSRIATGGMAEVYVGRHITPEGVFGPVVAVKRLLPHLVKDSTIVRMFLNERAVPSQLLVAEDLRAEQYRVLALDEDLASALRKFHAVQLPELPVTESEDSPAIVGVLSRRDVIAAYHDKMYHITRKPSQGPPPD